MATAPPSNRPYTTRVWWGLFFDGKMLGFLKKIYGKSLGKSLFVGGKFDVGQIERLFDGMIVAFRHVNDES